MKSKKANEFFADERIAFRTGGTYYVIEVDARTAVELAEEDARNRAIKAFKAAVIGVTEQGIERFLKAYDDANE